MHSSAICRYRAASCPPCLTAAGGASPFPICSQDRTGPARRTDSIGPRGVLVWRGGEHPVRTGGVSGPGLGQRTSVEGGGWGMSVRALLRLARWGVGNP